MMNLMHYFNFVMNLKLIALSKLLLLTMSSLVYLEVLLFFFTTRIEELNF